jgi:hypothetical protein
LPLLPPLLPSLLPLVQFVRLNLTSSSNSRGLKANGCRANCSWAAAAAAVAAA